MDAMETEERPIYSDEELRSGRNSLVCIHRFLRYAPPLRDSGATSLSMIADSPLTEAVSICVQFDRR